MTVNGWLQIALYSVIIILVTKPLGGYMTRVINGERTFLSPVLRPVERAIYWCCGVDERHEQHWVTYAIAMLFFTAAGFVTYRWRASTPPPAPDRTRPCGISTTPTTGCSSTAAASAALPCGCAPVARCGSRARQRLGN